jgi:hypothetical protein
MNNDSFNLNSHPQPEEDFIQVSDLELEMAAEAQFGGLGTTSTKAGCTTGAGGC